LMAVSARTAAVNAWRVSAETRRTGRVLGPEHPDSLTTCEDLSYWTAKARMRADGAN